MWHKLLRRQLRSIQIPSRQPVAPRIDLAIDSHRHLELLPIQDINGRVRDRLADRYTSLPAALPRHRVATGKSLVLRWSIAIEQPAFCSHLRQILSDLLASQYITAGQ